MLTDHPERFDVDSAVLPDDEFPVVPATEDFMILVRMSYTDPELAVLSVRGVPDSDSAPSLSRLLSPAFLANLSAIVLDLSKVPFLGAHGVDLVSQAQSYAREHNVSFGVVCSGAIERALSVSGLDATVPRFSTLSAARSACSAKATHEA